MKQHTALWIGLGLCGLLGLLTLSRSAQPAAAADGSLTHGPVVGAVTESSARVFARTDQAAEVTIRYSETEDFAGAITGTTEQTTAEHDFTTILPLTGLEAATVYYLDLVVDGVPQLAPPYPRFKTFPVPGTPAPFKVVVLNDFGENGSSKRPVPGKVRTFERASEENPDFVIIGGDFGHHNRDTLQDKRQQRKDFYTIPSPAGRYTEFIRKILYRYPVAHVWDDHDFGGNNADKNYPFRDLSYQVLNEYFPVYPLSPYGDWQKFSYADADFLMLDSRSQRDPNDDPNDLFKSMLDGNDLGSAGQLEWLKQGLVDSTATWKFIITPVTFNTSLVKPDSWRRFRYERKQLVDFITSNKITGVIMISGDAHMGALDDGTHSDFPEMLVPPPNLSRCATASRPGKWSHGVYWSGRPNGPPCNGYGVISVHENPAKVRLLVKDTEGKTRLDMMVNP